MVITIIINKPYSRCYDVFIYILKGEKAVCNFIKIESFRKFLSDQ